MNNKCEQMRTIDEITERIADRHEKMWNMISAMTNEHYEPKVKHKEEFDKIDRLLKELES